MGEGFKSFIRYKSGNLIYYTINQASEESIMKYYILLLGILISHLSAQTFNGIVINSEGQPLSYVIVKELHDKSIDNWTITNENGYFAIPLKSNAKIQFKRIGFQNKTIDLENNTSQVFILSSDNVQLKEVNVYGNNNSRYLKNKNFNNNLISFSKNGTLSQIPSLEIRTYGGYAGVTSASFNSGFSRHTKVLFNGVDLTDAQNGQVDLSVFPSFVLNSLKYRLNSGTTYGSGSIDGTLDISTKDSPNRIFYSSGNYGFNQYGATYSIGRETSKRIITIGKTNYDGDYEYKDSTTNTNTKRKNNYLDQFFLAMNREFLIRDDLLININSLKTNNTRGAAGSITFPSDLATRTDEYDLYALSFMKFFLDSSLKFYINRSTNNQVFEDNDESYPIYSEHDLESSSVGIDFEKEINSTLDYKLSAQKKSDRIASTDLNNQEMNASSISLLLDYFNHNKDLRIYPSMRYDKQSENKKLTYNFSIESINQFMKNNQSYFDFGLDIGSSFQFPTMNDLYWPDGLYSIGNPNLKPEESDYLAIEMVNNSNFGKFTITATLKDYKNLILWEPDELYKYRPINISSASRNNYNINYLKNFLNSKLQISYNMYDSKDDNGRKLLYVPDYSTNIYLYHKLNKTTNVALNYKYTGKRILQYAGDYNNQIDSSSYGLLDLSISRMFNQLNISLAIDNLFDKTFQSTLNYPEPGRSIKLTTEYNL